MLRLFFMHLFLVFVNPICMNELRMFYNMNESGRSLKSRVTGLLWNYGTLQTLIFAAALFLRLRAVLYIPYSFSDDALNYDRMARQFLDTGVLGYMSDKPNAYITPGYPLFLSLIYRFFGYAQASPFVQVRIIQAVLGAITCALTAGIAEKLFSRKAAVIASFAAAAYPTFVWAPGLLLTEVLHAFLLVAYIYVQIHAFESKKGITFLLAGVIFAAAVMVRPAVFPFLLLPFLLHYFKERDAKILKLFLQTTVGVLIVMMPWWIRNYISLGKIVILATQAGNPLIAGVFPYFENIDLTRYQVENQFAEGIRLALEGLLSNPFLYLKWYTVGKFNIIFGKMWLDIQDGGSFLGSLQFLHYFIVVLGWLGAAFAIVKRKINMVSAFLIVLTAVQLAFVPEPRYAYALMPLLIILAAQLTDYVFWGSTEKVS